jgi:LuxR family maltose regulon positive regulatory protein
VRDDRTRTDPEERNRPGRAVSARGDQLAGLPLLASKLVSPPLPVALVERTRLHALLDPAAGKPLTLVAAPAGSGKTVLLSSWVRAGVPQGRAAWLSVEPGDEGLRFWSYLHAALASAGVRIPAGRELRPVAGPGSGPDGFLTRFADALAGLSEPATVIVDDFHHITDAAVLDGLDFVLRHAASGLRLVISTRTDPALPLHRWRLRGELTELRADELSFTTAETADLLARHGIELRAADLDELHAQTEGWPAGVRLAALAIQQHPDLGRRIGQLAGEDPRIADYLIGEVFADQPSDVRDVLLRTSVLDRVSGGLIEALTGRTDGGRVLVDLERTNAFVIALDDRPSWYRYHRMFGELLRAELRRQAPERISELHRRAARWFATHDAPADALRHALAAEDWRYATAVLVEHWPDLVRYGHERRPAVPVPPPPTEAVRADPELALACAAERLELHDLDGADTYLRLADRHRQRLAEDRRDRFALMAAALRLARTYLRGDVEQLLSDASRMLALLPQEDAAPGRSMGDAAAAISLTAVGTAELMAGELPAAEAALRDGLARAERAAVSCARRVCAGSLALVRAIRGQLHSAARTAESALAMSPCPGQSRPLHRAHAYLALAVVDTEWDCLDDAESNVNLAAHLCDPTSDPALAATIAIVRAQLLRERGDLTGGYEALRAVRRDLCDWRPSRHLQQWFTAAEADLRTAHGDTATVRKLLAPLLDGARAPSTRLAIALARACLRDDDPTAAARALPAWADDGATGQPLRLRLEAGLIEALAARGVSDDRRASRSLERVLELAEPEGFRRIFTHAVPPVRDLLLGHLDSGTAYWSMISDLVAATDDRPLRSEPPPSVLGEPLTERELTVLRYMQSILSNVEIASELCLSVNTVKTHVRNIYRKLDATRRREAVRRARELRLL